MSAVFLKLLHYVTYNHVIIPSITFDRIPCQFRNQFFCFFTASVNLANDDLLVKQNVSNSLMTSLLFSPAFIFFVTVVTTISILENVFYCATLRQVCHCDL